MTDYLLHDGRENVLLFGFNQLDRHKETNIKASDILQSLLTGRHVRGMWDVTHLHNSEDEQTNEISLLPLKDFTADILKDEASSRILSFLF